MTSVRRLLALLACVAACQCALADRSRIADEVDVVEPGDCELEAVRERKSARGAVPERESSIRLGCGIGWQTEVAAAYARTRGDGARDEVIGVEAKTSLRERAIGRIGWTLAYGLDAERSGGGPWRRSEHFIAVEATLAPATAWLVEAKLGSAHDRIARSNRTLWALSVERSITEAVEALAEVGGDDRSRPLTSIGLRWLFWPEHALVTLSYGARAGPLRERRLGLGLTFEF